MRKILFALLLLMAGWSLLRGQVNTTTGRQYVPPVQLCGTTVACAKTSEPAAIAVYGSAPLTANVATLTGLPFTGTSTYFCLGTEASTAANNLMKFANASASSTVATTTAGGTDTINYICIGN